MSATPDEYLPPVPPPGSSQYFPEPRTPVSSATTTGWKWFAGVTAALTGSASGLVALLSLFGVPGDSCVDLCYVFVLLGSVSGLLSPLGVLAGLFLSLTSRRVWLRRVGIALMVIPVATSVVLWVVAGSLDRSL